MFIFSEVLDQLIRATLLQINSIIDSSIHIASVPRWGLLVSLAKIPNSQNFSGLRPSTKFSTGETTKPTGDDMKIQRGELINILL